MKRRPATGNFMCWIAGPRPGHDPLWRRSSNWYGTALEMRRAQALGGSNPSASACWDTTIQGAQKPPRSNLWGLHFGCWCSWWCDPVRFGHPHGVESSRTAPLQCPKRVPPPFGADSTLASVRAPKQDPAAFLEIHPQRSDQRIPNSLSAESLERSSDLFCMEFRVGLLHHLDRLRTRVLHCRRLATLLT